MTAVHEGNFMCADDSTHMLGHLSRSHIGPIGKGRNDIAFIGMRQLGIRTRDGSKMPRPANLLITIPENIEHRSIGKSVTQCFLKRDPAGGNGFSLEAFE